MANRFNNHNWQVTLYNHASGIAHAATGTTRKQAFKDALAHAGEEWLRAGGRDILTTLRTLYANHHDTARGPSVASTVMHPMGYGVEVRRIK